MVSKRGDVRDNTRRKRGSNARQALVQQRQIDINPHNTCIIKYDIGENAKLQHVLVRCCVYEAKTELHAYALTVYEAIRDYGEDFSNYFFF